MTDCYEVVGVVKFVKKNSEICRQSIYLGEPVFPFGFALVAGEGGLDSGAVLWCTPGRGGRMPQSIGAFSPHLTCARRPQSSHSSTGFQPRRLLHTSHLAARRVLEKINSSGLRFHNMSPLGGDALRLLLPFALVRFAPGLRSEKRCTSGRFELRMVEPPSVAAAIDNSASEDAVAV